MYDSLEGGYRKEDFLDFISSNNTAVLAAPSPDWDVQATTVFYAIEKPFSLLIKSHTTSDHGRIISEGSKVVLAIYDSSSTYTVKSGVQLRGFCERIRDAEEMKEAVKIYSNTFEGASKRFAPIEELVSADAKSTLFRVTILSGKLLTPEGYSEDFQSFQE